MAHAPHLAAASGAPQTHNLPQSQGHGQAGAAASLAQQLTQLSQLAQLAQLGQFSPAMQPSSMANMPHLAAPHLAAPHLAAPHVAAHDMTMVRMVPSSAPSPADLGNGAGSERASTTTVTRVVAVPRMGMGMGMGMNMGMNMGVNLPTLLAAQAQAQAQGRAPAGMAPLAPAPGAPTVMFGLTAQGQLVPLTSMPAVPTMLAARSAPEPAPAPAPTAAPPSNATTTKSTTTTTSTTSTSVTAAATLPAFPAMLPWPTGAQVLWPAPPLPGALAGEAQDLKSDKCGTIKRSKSELSVGSGGITERSTSEASSSGSQPAKRRRVAGDGASSPANDEADVEGEADVEADGEGDADEDGVSLASADSEDVKHAMTRTRQGKWTEAEHQRFLRGVIKHGVGRWSLVARVVCTRTTEQTRSHAQKFQIRAKRAGISFQECVGLPVS